MIGLFVLQLISQHFLNETHQLTKWLGQKDFQLLNVENSQVTKPASNRSMQIVQSPVILFVHFPIECKIGNRKNNAISYPFFFFFWLWKQPVISFLDLVLVWFWEWMSPNRNYCSMLCMLHPCWHSHNRVTYHKRAAETSGILMLQAMKTFISRLWVSPPFWSYSWYGVYILIWETRVFLSLHKW